MADTSSLKDPFHFYNNRFLKKEDEPAKIHSASKPTTDNKTRQKKKIKLLPFINKSGSDGRFVVTDSVTLDEKMGFSSNTESGNSEGYLPAQLSVQDLLPKKKDGGNQLPSNGDVVIVTAHDSSVLGELSLDADPNSNPYNRLNQVCHSVLWFPAFIFLFYIFCVPAIMYMRKSDEMYNEYDFKGAKRNGTISSVFYVGGFMFGLCFYAFVILLGIYLSGSY